MSAKRKAEERPNKSPVEVIKDFVAAGQAAQAAVEELEDPERIFEQFSEEIYSYCRKLKKHQAYFQEKKINPFSRLQAICLQNSLSFLDNFDKVAGRKA